MKNLLPTYDKSSRWMKTGRGPPFIGGTGKILSPVGLDLLTSFIIIRELFGDENGLRTSISRPTRPAAGGFLAKAKAQAAMRRELGKYSLLCHVCLLMYAPSARREKEAESSPSQASTSRTLSSTSIGANRGDGEGEPNDEGNCMVSSRAAQKRPLEMEEEEENRDPGPSTQRRRNQ